MARHVFQPGAENGLGRLVVDERRAERSVSVGPAQDDRPGQAVAIALGPRRKQAEEASRRSVRPDQRGANVAPKQRLSGERKRGLIEHVGHERTGSERAPLRGDRRKLREGPPLDFKGGLDRAVHGFS